MRHADSEDSGNGRDFDRSITEAGRQAARQVRVSANQRVWGGFRAESLRRHLEPATRSSFCIIVRRARSAVRAATQVARTLRLHLCIESVSRQLRFVQLSGSWTANSYVACMRGSGLRAANSCSRAFFVQVAEQLAARGWLPDLIVCSDSKRTQQTLKAMQASTQPFVRALLLGCSLNLEYLNCMTLTTCPPARCLLSGNSNQQLLLYT